MNIKTFTLICTFCCCFLSSASSQETESERPKFQFGPSLQVVKGTQNGYNPGVAISFDLMYRLREQVDLVVSLEGGFRRVHDLVFAFGSSSFSFEGKFRPIPSSNFMVGAGVGIHHMNAFCGFLCIDYEGPLYADIPMRVAPQFSMAYKFKVGVRIGLSYIPLSDENLPIRRPDDIFKF